MLKEAIQRAREALAIIRNIGCYHLVCFFQATKDVSPSPELEPKKKAKAAPVEARKSFIMDFSKTRLSPGFLVAADLSGKSSRK